MSSALLASQLPPLKEFSGEFTGEGETCQDLLERFEMVASLCGCNGRAKLINLTIRLVGQALSIDPVHHSREQNTKY